MKQEIQAHGGSLTRPDKGEVLNPNGRPKKSWTLFNQTLVKEGYQPLTKNALVEAYALIFALDEDRVSEIAEDKTQPLAIRLILQAMTDPTSRDRMMTDYRDYMFGKAKEESETKHTHEHRIFNGIDLNVTENNSTAENSQP